LGQAQITRRISYSDTVFKTLQDQIKKKWHTQKREETLYYQD
jgi:hypothetical protein